MSSSASDPGRSPEERTGQEAAAAGSVNPRVLGDPAAGLADGADITLDAFGRPSSSGIRVLRRAGKSYVHCLIRDRDVRYTPEELVRQHVLRKLTSGMGYPKDHIRVEVPIQMGSGVHDKPADIVVYTDATKQTVRIVVELKSPKRKDGIAQLQSYMNATGAPFGWWTNGSDAQFLLRVDPNAFSMQLTRAPAAGETLADIDEPMTKGRLKPVADLLDLLRVCEDEILAHQTVNTFDELFKVIYAKLYDERMNLAKPDDVCEFRIGPTEAAGSAAKRVKALYAKAKDKWKGVFKDDIELTDQNLAFVTAALQEYEFTADRSGDVMGVAFEAMINPETKGDKGQYFTPRHVVAMCVRMLNPRITEKVCDPAGGSSGFLIYAMKHVNAYIARRWGQNPDQAAEHRKDYAQEMLIAMDNDPRLVRIAKAYMIIENDGRSNVHQADSLDATTWEPELKRKLEDVAIVMTNPPFAGGIKAPTTLSQYDLAFKGDPTKNKQAREVVRAILFVERALRILKSGGRMAIVLPQGLMNNINDGYVRDYIDKHARMLAVVGLHENTFRPFSMPKTSVLFLEKWKDPDNRLEDYEFFTDVSRRPGKDSVGAPVWKADGALDTDVHEIAERFAAWAHAQEFEWTRDP